MQLCIVRAPFEVDELSDCDKWNFYDCFYEYVVVSLGGFVLNGADVNNHLGNVKIIIENLEQNNLFLWMKKGSLLQEETGF